MVAGSSPKDHRRVAEGWGDVVSIPTKKNIFLHTICNKMPRYLTKKIVTEHIL